MVRAPCRDAQRYLWTQHQRHSSCATSSERYARLCSGTIEQVIGVGTQTFDDNGGFTQVTNDKGSLSAIIVPNRAGAGTYAVNPDPSGTTTLNIPGLGFPIVSDFVIVDRGKEFRRSLLRHCWSW